VPIVVSITGEGGSGGALGIGVGDRVLMLEHAYYSVISPEGCAAILWKDQSKVEVAATALKLTAQDLKAFRIIDDVVPEPNGGAHSDPKAAAAQLDGYLKQALSALKSMPTRKLLDRRYQRFRDLGSVVVAASGTNTA